MRRARKPAPKKTIPFRPTDKLRSWLEAEKAKTDAPFQKIIERALDEYQKMRSA